MTNETLISISTAVLKAALICASTDQHRPYINGVYIDPKGYVVSTDGHRLFCAAINVAGLPAFEGWTIPSDVVKRAVTGNKFVNITVTPTQCGDIAYAPVDVPYPDWRRVLPAAELSGEVAQFNLKYVADMGKIMDLLVGKTSLSAHMHHNGESAAGVTFPACPSAFAILMPIRSEHTAPDTAWSDAIATATA